MPDRTCDDRSTSFQPVEETGSANFMSTCLTGSALSGSAREREVRVRRDYSMLRCEDANCVKVLGMTPAQSLSSVSPATVCLMMMPRSRILVRRLPRVIPRMRAAWTWLPAVCCKTRVRTMRSMRRSASS